MTETVSTITTIDLGFWGAARVIASFLAPTGDGGFVLVESGPASTIETLTTGIEAAGYRLAELRAILVTHVHLDHSGGAGVLARQTGCQVYVHPEGARHLADPGKLLASAERLYGERMIPLWGRTEPVPTGQLREIADAEELRIGTLDIRGWHTPGHARHHVAWQLGDAVATGDVAGVRFPGTVYVLPPTPPPDIDIDTWCTSIARIRDLAPARLLLTHFGPFDDALRHLDELQQRLLQWQELTRSTLADSQAPDSLAAELATLVNGEMARAGVPEDIAERYHRLCPMPDNAAGLLRCCSRELRA